MSKETLTKQVKKIKTQLLMSMFWPGDDEVKNLRVPYPKRASAPLHIYLCWVCVLAVFTQVYGTYFLTPVPNGY